MKHNNFKSEKHKNSVERSITLSIFFPVISTVSACV